MALQPVSWKDVRLQSGFWGHRHDINRRVTLPIEYQQCRQTGRIDAFKLQWKPGQPNQPHHFWDSDLAKWIEAVGYSLGTHPDTALEKLCDDVIDVVVSAQQPDGYLNIFYTVVQPGKRWTNLRDMHELYCAGHLIEAAVAYAQGTGKKKLLDAMLHYVHHIDSILGPEPGKLPGYCGHPEVELALMRMHRATGDETCLKLATFFVTERGRAPLFFDAEAKTRGEATVHHWQTPDYFQAHQPIVEQKTLEGHAVRALYLMSGVVDVAVATGDKKLLAAAKRLWKNVTQKRMYITGGVGSTRHNERFTFDYDLPNETAYAETCAAISLVFFAHRMLQLDPSSEYADVMERALYNGIASGVNLGGDHFFYANPLTVNHEALTTDWEMISGHRKAWFGCSCCPPNVARLFAWFGELIYSTSNNALWVHLYASSQTHATVAGHQVKVEMQTNYPWENAIGLTIHPTAPKRFALMLRIPGWSKNATLKINGKRAAFKAINGYAQIDRLWQPADHVELNIPLAVRLTETNPHCRNNVLKVAVERGPLVYCAEEVDHKGDVATLIVTRQSRFTPKWEPKLLGGIVTLTGTGEQLLNATSNDPLYRPIGSTKRKKVPVKLVPYAVWGNRKVGRMQVWLPWAG